MVTKASQNSSTTSAATLEQKQKDAAPAQASTAQKVKDCAVSLFRYMNQNKGKIALGLIAVAAIAYGAHTAYGAYMAPPSSPAPSVPVELTTPIKIQPLNFTKAEGPEAKAPIQNADEDTWQKVTHFIKAHTLDLSVAAAVIIGGLVKYVGRSFGRRINPAAAAARSAQRHRL